MEPRGVRFHEREQRTGLKMPIMHLSLATKLGASPRKFCEWEVKRRVGGQNKGPFQGFFFVFSSSRGLPYLVFFSLTLYNGRSP
jgi:hypothetical protein